MKPQRLARVARNGHLLCLLLMAACTTPVLVNVPEGPLQFVDLPLFDAQLRQVLDVKPDTVKIAFIDKVKPSQLPDRLKPWMTTLQNEGGEVKIVLPPGDLQPRGLPLLSLLPALWNALRGQKAEQILQESVRGYDAQIILKNDPSGDRLVESIVLHRR